ncbi:hypothetical protein [Chamaesiphon sp. VAR_69_metabat_338]|nr:hypothetical protein [Chamaesiphon sp. VAR_69_metabat_338]
MHSLVDPHYKGYTTSLIILRKGWEADLGWQPAAWSLTSAWARMIN